MNARKDAPRSKDRIDYLEERINEMFEAAKIRDENLSDKIDTSNEKIDKKFDAIDVMLRGNGRIGILETLRNYKIGFIVIFALLVILIVGKYGGISVQNIVEWFRGDTNIVVEENISVDIEKQKELSLEDVD